MKTNERIRVEVIPPKRRKAKEYRDNLYRKSKSGGNATTTGPVQTGPILLQQRKLSKKERQAIWNVAVDAAFAASKR